MLIDRIISFPNKKFYINDIHSDVNKIIISKIGDLVSKQDYIGIHIRMGDKIGKFQKDTAEAEMPELYKIPKIIGSIRKNDNSIKTIFIATDDYEAIKEIRKFKELNNMNIITFATEKRKGYNQRKFNLEFSTEESYSSNIDFLVDLVALFNSKYFIRTFSSNIMKTVIFNDKIKWSNIYNIENTKKSITEFPKWAYNLKINHV